MEELALRAPARVAILLPEERRQPRHLAVHPLQIGVRQLRPVISEQGPKNLVHRSITRGYFWAASRLAVSFRSRIT